MQYILEFAFGHVEDVVVVEVVGDVGVGVLGERGFVGIAKGDNRINGAVVGDMEQFGDFFAVDLSDPAGADTLGKGAEEHVLDGSGGVGLGGGWSALRIEQDDDPGGGFLAGLGRASGSNATGPGSLLENTLAQVRVGNQHVLHGLAVGPRRCEAAGVDDSFHGGLVDGLLPEAANGPTSDNGLVNVHKILRQSRTTIGQRAIF